MKNVALVGAGGMLGAISRYLLGGWISDFTHGRFPYGTLAINVSGSFVLGFFLALALETMAWGPEPRLFLAVGFLGAYTTFSTFSYETVALMREGSWLLALLNAGGNLFGCLVAVMCGIALAKALFG